MIFGKNDLVNALSKLLGDSFTKQEIEKYIKRSKDSLKGDLSFVCHGLSKVLRKSPNDLAAQIASELTSKGLLNSEEISEVECVNGYVNFRFNNDSFSGKVLEQILTENEDYGRNSIGAGKTVVIDYSAPNLGKPMHVGHIRSTIIGDSVINLLKFSGYKTHGINYLGDIGLHMGKLITAYNLWGNRAKLEADPEKEMFDLYVRFNKESENDKSLDEKAKSIVKKIEEGDKDSLDLMEKIRGWSMITFNRVYDLLGVKFDETTGQSYFSEDGKRIVKDALARGIAKYGKEKDESGIEMEEGENAGVIIDLAQYNLPPKVVLRSDGTALYSTQDLGAAVHRYEKHKFDKMAYVVATEQNLYFRQIFKILETLGHEWAKNCQHLGFGLIHFSEGRMSTREGKIVLLEDLLGKSVGMANKILEERGMPEESRMKIAQQIGIGAIKYMVLQVEPVKDITFSWDRALDFNGNSAPYIQYTYARASRIMERASAYEIPRSKISDLQLPEESRLLRKLSEFPELVIDATDQYKPNLLANYLNELAGNFNDFYEHSKVIGAEQEKSRLALVEATRTTMKNAANLLGIELPERM